MIRKEIITLLRPFTKNSNQIYKGKSYHRYGLSKIEYVQQEKNVGLIDASVCRKTLNVQLERTIGKRWISGDIQKRAGNGLEKAQNFAYACLAKTIHAAKIVRESNEFNTAKETIVKLYFWMIKVIREKVIENDRVKGAVNNFKSKLERANAIEAAKKKR